ncbi:hypothetical protein COH20_005028 [Aspergillus flavus]|uniref:Uncharacterized protein n=1 Tax=Aspergillus flavus TaxID=5059 RepID=A0AB74BRG3_ASPFL|nr:hypothetical protein AFLA_011708 [Aspergillus flavus NRRL3357]KAJ1717667.1 hypothetical protein NYO67_150 [Aspergillus flavus]RAQ73535.1 hypothetical protein COH20_005028 [Aspergillus flavus]RAQ74545.1 hypothetical protein COH21_003652 [Aspergillus flavus]RMZ37071.1 hypothetical protein CA14_006314 [Aspergillus flavus]
MKSDHTRRNRSLPEAPQLPFEGISMNGILYLTGLATLHLIQERSQRVQPKPLEEVDKVMKDFFGEGPDAASVKLESLRKSVLRGEAHILWGDLAPFSMRPLIASITLWYSCKLDASLVLLLASSPEPDSMFEALKFLSKSIGGLPTMADILKTPSTDLPKRFAQAIKSSD